MTNKILYVIVYSASLVAGLILYAAGKIAQIKARQIGIWQAAIYLDIGELENRNKNQIIHKISKFSPMEQVVKRLQQQGINAKLIKRNSFKKECNDEIRIYQFET